MKVSRSVIFLVIFTILALVAIQKCCHPQETQLAPSVIKREPSRSKHAKKTVALTDRTLPGDTRLAYPAYQKLLLSSQSIMKDLHDNKMNILDMWKINLYGRRIGFGPTRINLLPEQIPTGQPAYSYPQYRELLYADCDLIKNLHDNGLTIWDIWKLNKRMQLGEYKYQIGAFRSKQRAIYFVDGIPTYIFKICSGLGHDKFGVYWIDYKQVLHRSANIPGCEGVPMPFAWHFDGARFGHSSLLVSMVGIVGRSHGCVREYVQDAINIYCLIQYKTQFNFIN